MAKNTFPGLFSAKCQPTKRKTSYAQKPPFGNTKISRKSSLGKDVVAFHLVPKMSPSKQPHPQDGSPTEKD